VEQHKLVVFILNLFMSNFASKLWLQSSKMGSLNIGEPVLRFVELDVGVL
jgi:hypothetical protein